MKKIFVILLSLLATAVNSYAQLTVDLSLPSKRENISNSGNTSNDENGSIYYNNKMDDVLRRRAAEKVAQMNDYISYMSSKKKNIDTRKFYSEQAIRLFIAKGEAYEENGVRKEGVLMEVSSVNRRTKSKLLMKKYFNNLMNLKYTDVKIESTDVANIKVSQLQKIGEGQYVCTCQYDQAFVGYRDGKPVYKDITTKRIKCYVIAEETINGTEYILLLGDVSCISTIKG